MPDSSVRSRRPIPATPRVTRVTQPTAARRVAGPAVRTPRPREATPRPASVSVPEAALRYGAAAVLVVATLAAILLDRGLAEPVGHLGIVPQPGSTSVSLPENGLAAGDLAPNFQLRDTDGDTVTLADLRGQPVILHFWTSWCVACLAQMTALQELADAHEGSATVVGIDVGEDAGRARTAARDRGVRYPVVIDAEKEVAHHYGFWTFPITVVVGPDGTIVAIHAGDVAPGTLESELTTGDPS